MKNIKKIGKCGKRIAAMVLVMAMLLGVAAMVVGILSPARADDEVGQLDPVFYAAMYPDVVAAVGNDPLDLFIHYADHGIYEGRIPYAGAQPGEPINGYATVGINPDLAANATLVEQTGGSATTRDLSDWTPDQLAMLAQKQLEFDASPYIKGGMTEQQVYERMILIRDTMYPEGSIGGYCDSGSSKIVGALYGSDLDWLLLDEQGLLLCDKDGMRVMPVGYVECQTVRRANGGNIRDVRVGDMIYTNGSGTGHVQVVLSRDDKGITVVESNVNSDKKFHWGRRISWNELENGGNNIYQQQNKWTKYVHYLY